jgi:hypothetical protein
MYSVVVVPLVKKRERERERERERDRNLKREKGRMGKSDLILELDHDHYSAKISKI